MTKYTITQTEIENSETLSKRIKQIRKDLPNRLQHLRTDNGISQIALGKELGISNNQIYNYEIGESFPSPEALYSYSKFFEISMHEIIFGKNIDYPANTVSNTKERTCRFILDVIIIIHNCLEAKEDPA